MIELNLTKKQFEELQKKLENEQEKNKPAELEVWISPKENSTGFGFKFDPYVMNEKLMLSSSD